MPGEALTSSWEERVGEKKKKKDKSRLLSFLLCLDLVTTGGQEQLFTSGPDSSYLILDTSDSSIVSPSTPFSHKIDRPQRVTSCPGPKSSRNGVLLHTGLFLYGQPRGNALHFLQFSDSSQFSSTAMFSQRSNQEVRFLTRATYHLSTATAWLCFLLAR